MKILFFEWATFGDRDIVEALSVLGHEPVISDLQPASNEEDEAFVTRCITMLTENKVDMVFTSNFAPVVAEACQKTGKPYIAWVYDSPQLLLYHETIQYPTNYVFVFDSVEYNRLVGMGLSTVYYMPLAVNAKRLDMLAATEEEVARYSCDVAFVGSMYNEEHVLYERLVKKLSDYDRGYLEALLQAQRNVYGYYFLEERLAGTKLLERMYQAMPYGSSKKSFATREYIYGNYFLGRKLAEIERYDALSLLAPYCQVKVYTEGDVSKIPGVANMGPVNYYEEMPLAFRHAKINLNMSLRTIQSGIPLRCFDIMGAGGFLLTNYQGDFMEYFEPGVDYVYYDSRMDMLQKVDYYLQHEEERQEIAANGHRKVSEYHSYVHRLKEMLEIVGTYE